MIQTNIIDIGDPFILVHNNTYYMYSTISRAKDGFKCFSSKNLIDWEDNGFVYSKNDSWGEECFWAPEVYYYNGKFYLLFTAKWKKNHSLRTGLAVSDSPLGPFKKYEDNPILFYKENVFSGPGHNNFFKSLDGKLMTSFHIHTDYWS